MEAGPVSTVYIQLKPKVIVPQGAGVTLADAANLIAPAGWEKALGELVLTEPKRSDGNLLLIDMLTVIPLVRTLLPEADIVALGEARTIVQVLERSAGRKPSVALFVLVWLLMFFGSALTIMNFHADVSMQQVQVRIVELLTGRRDEHPYVFQAAYSLGIGFGMVIFFNHLFKKKWNEEPTPLEVEMFLYQNNVDQFIIHEEYRKMDRRTRGSGRKRRR